MIFDQFAHPNQPFWHKLYLGLIKNDSFEIKVFAKKTHEISSNKVLPLKVNSPLNKIKFLPLYFSGNFKRRISLRKFLNYPLFASDENRLVHILNVQQYPALAPFLEDKKLIFSFRGYETLVRPDKDSKWKNALQSIYDKASVLHFVSDFIKKAAIEKFDAPVEKCRVIRRSVDLDFFDPGKRNYSLSPNIRICTIGRLTWQKDYPTAINAIKILVDKGYQIEFHIAGEGKDKLAVQKLINKLGLDQFVIFHGNLDRKAVKDFLAFSDIYLQSSSNEALPNSILEASAMALPIVSTNVGGIPEALIHNKTALLVNPGHFQEMASEISDLIENKSKREEFGLAAREFMTENFHPDLELNKWLNLYTELYEA